MRITTFLIDVDKRRELIKQGKFNKCSDTNIYDGVSVKDLMNDGIKFLEKYPTNNVKECFLNKKFKKARRYYLFDNRKMLFGVDERALREPFEIDITADFYKLMETFIRKKNNDLNAFQSELNAIIEQTDEYKELQKILEDINLII